jgi:hypothetical protein
MPAVTRTTRSAAGHPGKHLVLNYQPSQPTGWAEGYTPSIGGHTTAKDFTVQGTSYRISLIPANPVYADIPSDPALKFRQTLAHSFGADYSLHYQGGFTGRNEFSVESYNAWVTRQGPGVLYGADLYVVYHPGHGDPGIHSSLQWAQVFAWLHGPPGPPPGPTLDNSGRANPFYTPGGLTSINGNQAVTFYDRPQISQAAGNPFFPIHWQAELFLIQDTGIKDAAGKDVVNVFGGLTWGWQVTRS